MHHDYHRPRSLTEALELARQTPAARFVAGGTDLLVALRKRRISPPPALISLRSIPELRGIEAGERLRIGAATPLTDIADHPRVREHFAALARAVEVIGSRQIRNAATLGGNLCNASPAADTAPALLVHDACVELASEGGTREVPLAAFLLGRGETALRAGEVLGAVLLEPVAAARSLFLRKGRTAMDLAIASVAVRWVLRDGRARSVRVAAGAVAPVALRLGPLEELLEGARLEEMCSGDLLERVRAAAREPIAPISDLRASAEYRSLLTGVLAARAVESLARGERATAGGAR
ncbi:MAG: xanthine dehydrogenase family protein subunit M [Planctomycetota bacterium]|jgi:carbon-monoxide dehydrogenase medium subunit|nr:xanthine dehydrogenase family protein subunit M [Planctomycetota bacterium]